MTGTMIDLTGHLAERVGIEKLDAQQRALIATRPELVDAIVAETAEGWGILLSAEQRQHVVAELQRRAGTA